MGTSAAFLVRSTIPPTVAPSLVAASPDIPKNASAVAVATGGCEVSTPTLGYVPIGDYSQAINPDQGAFYLKQMLREQIEQTNQEHIDSLALLFQQESQRRGPSQPVDWIAVIGLLEQSKWITNVLAWHTVVIYANVGVWERCYTDYSFDVPNFNSP